ncbi:unnamed protein product [Trichobilharzia regenti]|nr:unnamed protein product [Trichobilharzia regenti]
MISFSVVTLFSLGIPRISFSTSGFLLDLSFGNVSVLDRLGSRPVLDANNKVNSYAWMSMNHDSVDNQQVANDTLQRGNRSRWRLERNPASGDALLSGDEEDDIVDENPVTDFSGTSNFVKVSNKMDHNDNKLLADNFLDYNSDQDTTNLVSSFFFTDFSVCREIYERLLFLYHGYLREYFCNASYW